MHFLTSTSFFNDEQLVLVAEIMKQFRIECWGDVELYSLGAVQLCGFPAVSSVGGPYCTKWQGLLLVPLNMVHTR